MERFDLNEETIRLDSLRFYWSKNADFKIYIPKLEIGRGEKVLLLGEQGVGKNKLADKLLSLLKAEREYVQLHRTPPDPPPPSPTPPPLDPSPPGGLAYKSVL